jgi:hypothetical protein
MIMKKILSHILAFTILSLPLFTYAAVGLQNPLKGVNSISELILIVTRVVRYIAIPFVVLAIMYSGWLFIWNEAMDKGAGGRTKAKEALWYTVIGAFILLSAELIALVLRNTINSATQ